MPLKCVSSRRDEVPDDYNYDGARQIKKLSYGNGMQTEYNRLSES